MSIKEIEALIVFYQDRSSSAILSYTATNIGNVLQIILICVCKDLFVVEESKISENSQLSFELQYHTF